jgi:hypothetical protein
MNRKRNWWLLIPAAIGFLVFGAVAVLAIATQRFEARSDGEVRGLFAAAEGAPGGVVRAEELEGLPAPVQHWLNASGAVGG